jgi:hypothetical protein
MKNFFPFSVIVFLAAAATVLSGCNKDFDSPPGPSDLPIVANTSIASLKALHTVSGQMDEITDDIIISALVTANDESGNLYKELFIEDTSGAIKLLLDASGLYATYPVGRRVYIYCKGLWISDDNGLMIMGTRSVVSGTPSLQGILNSDITKYVKGGSINNSVVPTTVTFNQLGTGMQDPYIGRLIKLEGYEFTVRDTAKTYSDTSVYRSDKNDTIQSCSGTKTIIRTSAYANFAAVNVPNGNGDLTAIYTVYRTTKQFVIRDTADVAFYGPRCGSTPPPLYTRISISQLRARYNNTNIKITDSTSIEGVVISDATNKNISTGAVVLQQGNAGIVVYFGGTIPYNIGDSLVIDITNDSLIYYRGYLEVKKASSGVLPPTFGNGRTVVPQVKTIAEINTALSLPLYDPGNIENTLVKVVSAAASGNATFSGSNTLTDNTGTITLYTSATALFSGNALPTGSLSWTGYTQNYNQTTKELLLRNAADVQ